MANKIYTVMKDGEVLKELKTLAAAKKLADTEDAEVFCEGLCVYTPDPVIEETDVSEVMSEGDVEDAAVEAAPVIKTVTPDKYRLKHRMNVRKAPSKEAEKAGTKPVGAFVMTTALWSYFTPMNLFSLSVLLIRQLRGGCRFCGGCHRRIWRSPL